MMNTQHMIWGAFIMSFLSLIISLFTLGFILSSIERLGKNATQSIFDFIMNDVTIDLLASKLDNRRGKLYAISKGKEGEKS